MKRINKMSNKNNYTKVDSNIVRREDMSLKAKGLLLYLLGLPEDWELTFSELMTHHTDGHNSTRTALDELKEKGYVKYHKTRNDKGHYKHIYEVFEEPYKDTP